MAIPLRERLLGRFARLTNRFRVWYRLPFLLAMPTLLGHRVNMREHNLSDTERDPSLLKPLGGASPRDQRAADGSYNDLGCPWMGMSGARFGRNVAIAMHADMEFKQPNIPDPVHMKAEELQMLSENLFKGMKAEMFSSRLPSDPGLKVYVADATLERKLIPKKSVFGRQFINRQTGQPETEEQRLFDG